MLEFRNVLRLNPKNADALYHVGLIQERADRRSEAYQAYQAAVAERPKFVEAQYHMGIFVALRADDLVVAERAAEAIEQVEPASPDGLALQSAVMLRQGDVQRAKDVAEEALAKVPGHTIAVGVIVGALRQRGRVDEAIAYLERAIAANPQDSSSRLLRIALLEEAGKASAILCSLCGSRSAGAGQCGLSAGIGEFSSAAGPTGGSRARRARHPGARPAITEGGSRPHGLDRAPAGFHRRGGRVCGPDRSEPGRSVAPHRAGRPLHAGAKTDEAEATLEQVVERAGDEPIVEDARARIAAIKLAAGDEAAAARIADEVLARDAGHRQANLVKGQLALANRKWDDAIRSARTALRDNPDWLPALTLLANTYLESKNQELAAEALTAILRREPSNIRAAGQLASILTQRGDLDGAIKVFDQVADATADPTPALLARTSLAVRQQNWLSARADLQRLQQAPGQEAATAFLAGSMFFGQGDFKLARQAFAEAAALQPDAWEPVVGLVQAAIEVDDMAGAQAYLDERRARRPDDALAHELAGELLARSGDLAGAETALREAIRLRPTWSTPYRQLAALRERAGDPKGAAAAHAAEAAQRPDDPNVLMRLALAQMEAGEFDAAIDSYAAVLAKVPSDDVALNNYAALIADHRHDRPEELRRALDGVRRFKTSDNPALLDTLGWLYYRNQDYLSAVTALDRALTLAPDRAPSRARLGMALYRSGQHERAVVELDKALAQPGAAAVDPEVEATFRLLQAKLAATPRPAAAAP